MLKIINGEDCLLISREIIKEVVLVLANKFSSDRESLSRVAVNLSELGEIIEIRKRIRVLKDEPDNRILECAVSGRADIIVTGDKTMLKLKEYGNVKIVSLREYLD